MNAWNRALCLVFALNVVGHAGSEDSAQPVLPPSSLDADAALRTNVQFLVTTITSLPPVAASGEAQGEGRTNYWNKTHAITILSAVSFSNHLALFVENIGYYDYVGNRFPAAEVLRQRLTACDRTTLIEMLWKFMDSASFPANAEGISNAASILQSHYGRQAYLHEVAKRGQAFSSGKRGLIMSYDTEGSL